MTYALAFLIQVAEDFCGFIYVAPPNNSDVKERKKESNDIDSIHCCWNI